MKCDICGNTDINDILVTFQAETKGGEPYLDTTTLPKFLYYLEHPNDWRGKSLRRPYRIKKVIGYSCCKCHPNKSDNPLESGIPFHRIRSTRYGV